MDGEALEKAAARLRAANALGRSDVLRKLFEFLLERSRAGSSPKEIEVASAVFGGPINFDPSLDASVRVYVHRLRKKLEDYYAGAGKHDPVRLTIPKGEYRVVAQLGATGRAPQPLADLDHREPHGRSPGRFGRRSAWIVGAGLVLVLNILAWTAFWWSQSPNDSLAQDRRAAPWAALLGDQRPITVVVGDYYIFGDSDRAKSIDRLVREYTVNSRADLDAYRMEHPEMEGRYQDLDLYYLPVASAFALRSLMPLLAPSAKDRERIRVVLSSDLTPDMLRRSDIVYIGYISGLGLLRDPVFAGSRFTVGDTYDELIDSRTNRHFISEEGGPDKVDQQERDMGYFSAFAGPNGNRIVIVAGGRDTGLTQMAEEASNPASLAAIAKAVGGGEAFEALYDVQGIRRSNLGGRLLLASPLKTDGIWSGQPSTLQFPSG